MTDLYTVYVYVLEYLPRGDYDRDAAAELVHLHDGAVLRVHVEHVVLEDVEGDRGPQLGRPLQR